DAKPRELPTSVLSSILREVDKQLQILEDNDYNAERSRIAVRGKKEAKQQTLDVFLKSTPKKQTEDTEPQPSTSGIRHFFLPSHATKTAPDDDTDDDAD
ncbi:putative Tigger transposable element-derived protein 1-like 328, partial [Homarus americanus]